MFERRPVGRQGELVLGEAQRRHWGLVPGGEVLAAETAHGLLLRPADPPLTRVYVEPTSRCNLDCRTCVRHSWGEPGGVMSMTTYRRLIAGLRHVPTLRKVSFWGFGEPLLHPHLVEMVKLAKALGAQTEIITNGLLLDYAKARALVEVGLDTIVFSVDGASPQAYADVRSGGELRPLLENVAVLQELREGSPRQNPEIGIEFVAMRSNVHELPALRHLAYRLGATFIVVSNVLPYTAEMADETLYDWAVSSVKARERNRWMPQLMLPTIDVRRDAAVPVGKLMEYVEGEEGLLRRLSGNSAYCKFVGDGSLAVRWDGEASPCVALMHSYTCYILRREKRIRHYSVGNVAAKPILDIWQEESFRRFRARVQGFDFSPCVHCGGCHLSEGNEEDCFGNPFPVCGDCLWAQGAIQCP